MTDQLIDKKQKLLLSYLLSDRESFVRAYRILKPEYFDAPLDRVVKVTLEHFTKYHNLPDLELIEAETDVILTEKDVEPADRTFLLEEIEQHCKDQAMSIAILESVDLVEEGKLAEVQELVRKALLVKIDDSVGIAVVFGLLSIGVCVAFMIRRK